MTQRSLNNTQLVRAAVIVLLGFITSGLLGLVRLGIVSSAFGTSEAMDAFIAAQRIPETIFTLVAGGALGSSFIPIYARIRARSDADAWQLASATMTLSALAAMILAVLVFVFADPLVAGVLLQGRSSETQHLTAALMRIMMLTPIVFSISGLVMGILQSHGLFLLPSIAISMNNIGIMIGALVIAPLLTPDAGIAQVGMNNIYGLAYGAVLSAVLHLVVQLPGLWRLRAPLRILPNWRITGVLDVLRLMIPRSIGQGVVQINNVVNNILAAGMVAGSLVALQTAFTLMFFALGVIGQSVGAAVFPTLAAAYAQNDMESYRQRLVSALRSVLFLALPAMVIFLLLGESLISVFERAEWTRASTQATSWALGFYATGIAGFTLLEVLSRAFYALEDTWTPVIAGVGAMVSNIVLSLVFVRVIGSPDDLTHGAFGGLALANALTTNLEALALYVLLRRRIGALDDRGMLVAIGQVLLATAAMAGAILLLLAVVEVRVWWVGMLGIGLGGIVFFGVALIVGLEEARTVPNALLRRFRRR